MKTLLDITSWWPYYRNNRGCKCLYLTHPSWLCLGKLSFGVFEVQTRLQKALVAFRWWRKNKNKKRIILTWPNWSKWLFVNLTFWKLIVCRIHCAPLDGPSGCTYKRPGRWGSALPATVHSELWNLYRLSSTGTISITRMYFSFGFNPEMLILITGNIRLMWKCIQRKCSN